MKPDDFKVARIAAEFDVTLTSARRLLEEGRVRVCSSGCVHRLTGRGKLSGHVAKGTKPKSTPWRIVK